MCVSQSGASATAVRGWRSGRGSVLDGSDDDTGGSPSADAEDCPTGKYEVVFSLRIRVHTSYIRSDVVGKRRHFPRFCHLFIHSFIHSIS